MRFEQGTADDPQSPFHVVRFHHRPGMTLPTSRSFLLIREATRHVAL
jgi:hypothetical protein